MNTINHKLLVIAIAAITLSSCTKEVIKPDKATADAQQNLPSISQSIVDGAQRHSGSVSGKAGFLTPFFTSEGFGVVDVDAQIIAYFTSPVDGNDFYRKNPDGSISVHITSTNALAEHYDYARGVYCHGRGAHMTIDYTGSLIEEPVFDEQGNFLYIGRFIDFLQNPSAVTMHGRGYVQANGTGPQRQLSGAVVMSPAWNQGKFTLNLK